MDRFENSAKALALLFFPGIVIWFAMMPFIALRFHILAHRYGLKRATRRCQEPLISSMYLPYGVICGGAIIYWLAAMVMIFMPAGFLIGAFSFGEVFYRVMGFYGLLFKTMLWAAVPLVILVIALFMVACRTACSQLGVFVISPRIDDHDIPEKEKQERKIFHKVGPELALALGASSFVLPCDIRRNTLTQNIFKLRAICDFCRMECLPLSGIRQFTRDSNRTVYINGTFGARRVVWASKQKRDECLYMLYDSCATFCHPDRLQNGAGLSSGLDMGDL